MIALGKKHQLNLKLMSRNFLKRRKPPLEIFTINKQISENPNQFRLFPSL
jgi:hypothetical protein